MVSNRPFFCIQFWKYRHRDFFFISKIVFNLMVSLNLK